MLKNGAHIICVHVNMYLLTCFYSFFGFVPCSNHIVSILKHLVPGFLWSISVPRVHLSLYTSVWVWWIPQHVNTSLMLGCIFVVYYLWIVNENYHAFQKVFSSECLSSRKSTHQNCYNFVGCNCITLLLFFFFSSILALKMRDWCW